MAFWIVTPTVGATLSKKRTAPSTVKREAECSFQTLVSYYQTAKQIYSTVVQYSICNSEGGSKKFTQNLYGKFIRKIPSYYWLGCQKNGHKSGNRDLNNSRCYSKKELRIRRYI